MKLSTPRWWYVREGAPAPVMRALLKPVSWIWAAVTARRIARASPSRIETSAIAAVSLPKGEAMATPRARWLPSSAVKGPRFQPPDRSPTACKSVVSRALPASSRSRMS